MVLRGIVKRVGVDLRNIHVWSLLSSLILRISRRYYYVIFFVNKGIKLGCYTHSGMDHNSIWTIVLKPFYKYDKSIILLTLSYNVKPHIYTICTM